MSKYYYNKNKEDSPLGMYLIAIIMFFLLIFTILSLMHDKSSSLYLNFDKKIYEADLKAEENVEINENKISKEMRKPDIIDKAIDKLGDEVRYDKYKADYDQYYEELQKKRRQEFERRQQVVQKAQEMAKREHLERIKREKLARMQDTVRRPVQPQPTIYPQQEPQRSAENKIVSRTMQNSPCAPQSATAIAYFFHQNNPDPIELIFNDPSPSFSNGGNVKLVFGDLPRDKQHILKRNMVNLNQILNKPKFTKVRNEEAKRPDALKVQSGVTTACSPYVYQSKDFYLSPTPPSLEDSYTKEVYCRNHNARLADPIELIPVLLTGKLPVGLYWTSSRVYKMAPGKTVVSKSNMISTQANMLVDFGRGSLGFVSQDEIGHNTKAYSVCVFDE